MKEDLCKRERRKACKIWTRSLTAESFD